MSAHPQPRRATDNFLGAIEVMLGRESGLKKIDLSASGFALSIIGLALAGLLDISALSLLHDSLSKESAAKAGKTFYIFAHLLIALIGYGASFVALYLLCREPDEQKQFLSTVIVHNWAAPVVSLVFFPFLFLILSIDPSGSTQSGNTFTNMISVFWIVSLLFVGYNLIRWPMNVEAGRAIVLFVVTALVSLVCTEGLQIMFGLHQTS